MVEGEYYFASCRRLDSSGELFSRVFQYQPGIPPIDPETLARRAASLLSPAYPVIHTSPEAPINQLVGIDTWLWTEPAAWQPQTATASIPGLTVSATATPTGITWNMGDGTAPITCTGPGTPYNPDLPDRAQTTNCSHLYQDFGTYQATATLAYTVTWTATNGAGGTLTATNRTTPFTMTVAEYQVTGTN